MAYTPPPSSQTSRGCTIKLFATKDTSPGVHSLTCQSRPLHLLYAWAPPENFSYSPIQSLWPIHHLPVLRLPEGVQLNR